MKKLLNMLIGILAYFAVLAILTGYGHTETHPHLNTVIVLKFLDKFDNKGFSERYNYKFKNYKFNWNNSEQPELKGMACAGDALTYSGLPDDIEKSYTPIKWISEAGWMEDEPWGPASLCHFYDPIGIDGGYKYLTDCSGKLEASPIIKQVKEYSSVEALSWAQDYPDHPFTWKIAKQCVVKALKEPDLKLREKYMALAYRCLGQVLHLVCDMGCPPHVRNDSHPPNFYVIGDPDIFEEVTKKLDVYTLWQDNPPSSSLKDKFNSFEKFEDLFVELATNTNENFFSGQTIVTDRYKPFVRPDNPYPKPIMGVEQYNYEKHAYIADYNGVSVVMCKDLVAVPFSFLFGKDSVRGRPYLDAECVKSMAAAIYPNIAEAGANVIRMFVPPLKVEITEAKADSGGVVRGKVSYTIPTLNDEYSTLFDLKNLYNGPVSLYINGKKTKIQAEAKNNYFEFRLKGKTSKPKEEDYAVAEIEFGGIVVDSDKRKFSETIITISSISPEDGAMVGDEITIFGSNFGTDLANGKVFFNDVEATEKKTWLMTHIKVIVPPNAESGFVRLECQGSESNQFPYKIKKGNPVITYISPDSAKAEDVISIHGRDFGNEQYDGSIPIFYGLETEIKSWSDSLITIVLPLRSKKYINIVVKRFSPDDEWAVGSNTIYNYRVYPDIFTTMKRIDHWGTGFFGMLYQLDGREREIQVYGGYTEDVPVRFSGNSFNLVRTDYLDRNPGQEIFYTHNTHLTVSGDGKSISGTINYTDENRGIDPTLYGELKMTINNMKLLSFDEERITYSCTESEGSSVVGSLYYDGGWDWNVYNGFKTISGSIYFYEKTW
ncbi:MAG: IPT/TIG domain-containing protein [Prolixibacteraceae bacterium]|nr:IPT/TIG domain-containing protein [Prolixibacteraceae bacterium]